MIRTDLIAPLGELLKRQAERFAGKIAYEDGNRAITYGALHEEVANLATRLASMGITAGGSVAVWLPNSVDWVVACFAIVRAGGVAVPISYDATLPEVAYRLDDASCDIVITRAEKFAVLDELQTTSGHAALRIATDAAAEDPTAFRTLCASPAPCVALPREDIDKPAYIIYTSGTTGKAKGVLLTTRGMLWVNAACWAPIYGMTSNDTVLSPLPLFHSYALNISVLAILANGATEYIMERFSPQKALELLASGRFTLMPGVPTMFHYMMLAAQQQDQHTLGALRRCVSAGAIMPSMLNTAFENQFGIELLDGYGITETSTMVTMNWPGKSRIGGSCGLALPGLAVRIVDPATGLDVERGGEGELICRGPNVMLGYHNKPEETAKAVRAGWYHTGDLARSDAHGFLTITGRLKELIIRGGQNIAPAEVEEAILTHESVKDCAVVGVPHDMLGEVPVVFVVPRAGDVDAEGLLVYCRQRLSSYKVPAAIVSVQDIPRTGSGKIMRFRLREHYDAINRA